MRARRSLARTGMFAGTYGLASVAGRLTVMDAGNLSLIWPAAGVAVIWFCAQRRSPVWWADVAALTLVTLIVNVCTGATVPMALVFAAANLVQVLVFRHLIARWRPRLWGAGGTEGMRSPRDLWALLGASFTATAAGVAIGPPGLWLVTGWFSGAGALVWLSRNTASILLIGAVGLCVGHALTGYRDRHGGLAGWWRHALTRLAATPRWRIAECAALVLCSTGAYLAGFSFSRDLPLAFTLIAVTVWAGTRLATPFVVLHDLIVGVIAVLFTLRGVGPFADIPDHATRAVIAQLFVAIVAVVGLSLALGRDERTTLLAALAAEKAELAVQREQAAERAVLLREIIDSTADGLMVIGPDGRLVLSNPAADHLLGGSAVRPGETIGDSSRLGLFHLDGSPLAADEMVHLRALAGEEVADLDILVRNAGVPEGRVVTVRAATLTDGAGRRSAVVLFHDVTAERRHRDELTNFAGVVAHDLLNPVTTVEGWSEYATEILDEVPDHPAVAEARDAVGRVHRAGRRMRALIDGLLAYTTARDATVAAVPVELSQVVTEVTVARLDAAIAAGDPVPRFTVGDLPAVRADPVLIRQLLDNLIGNAVKYTAPGVTPELTVTAERDDDMVRVRIRDNGIGIPAGQHDAIFGNFHRAHRTGPWNGTGLGLGICKRIVERHGGTIAAEDNPHGGSSFTFTMPATVSPAVPAPAGEATGPGSPALPGAAGESAGADSPVVAAGAAGPAGSPVGGSGPPAGRAPGAVAGPASALLDPGRKAVVDGEPRR